MSKNLKKQYINSKNWRIRTKKRMVEAMGGQCQCCGYNAYIGSLHFHHINDDDDSYYRISTWRIRKWNRIVEELRKCILVCANCHGELHANLRTLPNNYQKFNEQYVSYEHEPDTYIHPSKLPRESRYCRKCNKGITVTYNSTQRYCSYKCSNLSKQRVNWSEINLLQEVKTKTISQIAKDLGVSWHTVKKHLSKQKPW